MKKEFVDFAGLPLPTVAPVPEPMPLSDAQTARVSGGVVAISEWDALAMVRQWEQQFLHGIKYTVKL
jgi:hypothetical protein